MGTLTGVMPGNLVTASIGKGRNIHPLCMDCQLANCSGNLTGTVPREELPTTALAAWTSTHMSARAGC